VVEIHGSIHEIECLSCGRREPTATTLARVEAGEADPPCLDCGGVLKTTTISFGQPLRREVLQAAVDAARRAELFLAVGTSLSVHPAASLVDVAVAAGARLVIVNAEETPYDRVAHAVVRDRIGEALPNIVAAV